MILYVQTLDGHRDDYRISSYDDFNKIYEIYPAARQIVIESDGLKEAAEEVASYLSNHNLESWVEGNDLSKGLKEKLLGVGLAASMAASHSMPRPAEIKAPVYPGPITQPTGNPMAEFEPSRDYLPFGKHKADRFLWNIEQIESSGGKNFNHPMVENGSFRGMRAIGKWGFMPPTIKDIVKMREAQGNAPREITSLAHKSPEELRQILETRPHVELELARTMANYILKRQGGNQERSAYSWLNGQNLTPEDIPAEKLQGHDYVQKYKTYDAVNPFKSHKMVRKSESSFGSKVKNWMNRRLEQSNKLMPRYPQENDPGRLHEDKDIPQPKDAIDKIRQSIDDAKEGRKS